MTDLLAGVLASGALGELSEAHIDALWEEACATRVDVLVASVALREKGMLPDAARRRMSQRLRAAQAMEMVRHREISRIVEAFDSAGVHVLLLKGAALAYTVYPQPHLRPADDIDLFIRHEARAHAERSLAACGYERVQEPDVELASSQRHYVQRDAKGPIPWVDLHWRVANPRVFGDAISFEDAWSASVPVLSIGRTARTLATPDALLLACVHRVAHHQDRPDLLWIWDIHLLAGQMTAVDGDVFVQRAERGGICAVSVRGLELAHDRFRTPAVPSLIQRLRSAGACEPSSRFLGGGLRQVDVLTADLAATKSLGHRLQLLREHLFPPRAYIRARYPQWPGIVLPFAYADRIIRGAPKWFQRPPAAISRPSPSLGKESGR